MSNVWFDLTCIRRYQSAILTNFWPLPPPNCRRPLTQILLLDITTFVWHLFKSKESEVSNNKELAHSLLFLLHNNFCEGILSLFLSCSSIDSNFGSKCLSKKHEFAKFYFFSHPFFKFYFSNSKTGKLNCTKFEDLTLSKKCDIIWPSWAMCRAAFSPQYCT